MRLYFLLILFILPFLTKGQESKIRDFTHGAFEDFTLGGGYSLNINKNSFHNYWIQKFGMEGWVESPFYAGSAVAGIQPEYFKNFPGVSRSFIGNYTFLGWSPYWLESNKGVHTLWAGGTLGIQHFVTKNGVKNEEWEFESEISVGIRARFQVNLFSGYMAYVSAHHRYIFTQKNIELSNISLGVSRKFGTPQRLKRILE